MQERIDASNEPGSRWPQIITPDGSIICGRACYRTEADPASEHVSGLARQGVPNSTSRTTILVVVYDQRRQFNGCFRKRIQLAPCNWE